MFKVYNSDRSNKGYTYLNATYHLIIMENHANLGILGCIQARTPHSFSPYLILFFFFFSLIKMHKVAQKIKEIWSLSCPEFDSPNSGPKYTSKF